MLLALLMLACSCALVAIWCARQIASDRRAPVLVPCTDPPDASPLISVLIPARDEAARIGACLEGLARQSYQRFELIVVDDRSADGTGRVVRSYAGRFPALHIVPGAPLPPGWAGKCWACWQAAARASGEWLLFLDADVIPQPGLLASLTAHAIERHLDLLTVMPLLRLGSLAERAVLPAFMSLLYGLYPLDRVSDPCSPLAFANGQCLLVRRSIYAATGGHRAVQASLLEDVELGRRVKAAGYRIAAAAAPDLIEVRMYHNWRDIVEGLSKNAVAGYRSGGRRSLWIGVQQALIAFLPLDLLIAGASLVRVDPGVGGVVVLAGALLAMLTFACNGWLARRRYRIAPAWALLYPLGLAIYFGLAARAFARLRRGQGVTWKGRRFRES